MSIELPFSEMNVAPDQGAEIMEVLGLTSSDLTNHRTFSMLSDVIKFFKQYDPQEVNTVIKKVTLTSRLDGRLPKLYEWVQLKQQHDMKALKLKDLEDEYLMAKKGVEQAQEGMSHLERQ